MLLRLSPGHGNIIFSIPGMNKWLHRWFHLSKNQASPIKFSEEKQRQFIEYYKELKITVGDEPILLLMESIRLRPLKSAMAGYAKARKKQ